MMPIVCKRCGHEEWTHLGHLCGEIGGKDISEFVDVPCQVEDCGCEMFEPETQDGSEPVPEMREV